jgi:hypothetical protein
MIVGIVEGACSTMIVGIVDSERSETLKARCGHMRLK